MTAAAIPMPGDKIGAAIVVASTWWVDDGPPFLVLVLLLDPEPPYYRVTIVEWNAVAGAWWAAEGEDTFPNIVPAAAHYRRLGGNGVTGR